MNAVDRLIYTTLLRNPTVVRTRYEALLAILTTGGSYRWDQGEIVADPSDDRSDDELIETFFSDIDHKEQTIPEDFYSHRPAIAELKLLRKERKFRLTNLKAIAMRKNPCENPCLDMVGFLSMREDSLIFSVPENVTPEFLDMVGEFIEHTIPILYALEERGLDLGMRERLIQVSEKCFPNTLLTLTHALEELMAS